jgi:hypothetical protein
VSREEFDDMVAQLGVESKPAVAPPRQTPAGGRRGRPRTNGTTGEADGPAREPTNEAARKKRRPHGRSR